MKVSWIDHAKLQGNWLQGLVPYRDDDDIASSRGGDGKGQGGRVEGGAGGLYKSSASALFARSAGPGGSPKGGQKASAWFPQHISGPGSGSGGGGAQQGQQASQQQRALSLQVCVPHWPPKLFCLTPRFVRRS